VTPPPAAAPPAAPAPAVIPPPAGRPPATRPGARRPVSRHPSPVRRSPAPRPPTSGSRPTLTQPRPHLANPTKPQRPSPRIASRPHANPRRGRTITSVWRTAGRGGAHPPSRSSAPSTRRRGVAAGSPAGSATRTVHVTPPRAAPPAIPDGESTGQSSNVSRVLAAVDQRRLTLLLALPAILLILGPFVATFVGRRR
jgi:hypothetical protein